MDEAEQQYDVEKMALLLEKQSNEILKDEQMKTAALCYYYGISLTEASDMSYGDAELLIKAARVFKAQEALQQIATVTAALSGGKASKLIKQLERDAKW